MDFSRFFLLLRLPLVALVCGLLVGLPGNYSQGDHWVNAQEATEYLDERDDNTSFGAVSPVVIIEDALIQLSNWVSLELGYAFKAASELHATGPPTI